MMKNLLLLAILVFASIRSFTQSIAINTSGNVAEACAILDISSQSKGILIPRMTTSERTAIMAPQDGLLVFDTDARSFWFYSGSWQELISGSDMGNAGGDLTGQYPTPIVAKLQGHDVSALSPDDRQALKWDNSVHMWKGMRDSLSLPYVATGSSATKTFSVTNSFNEFSNTTAIHAQRIDPSGIPQDFSTAIWGDAYIGTGILGTSSFHPGIYGKSLQSNGIEGYAVTSTKAGVFGYSPASQGVGVRGLSEDGAGVEGITHDINYPGVYGKSTASINSVGVRGDSNASDSLGVGVYGTSSASSDEKGGVLGYNNESGGIGVNGRSPFGTGVYGFCQTPDYPAIKGYNQSAGTGVYGVSWELWFADASPVGVKGKVYTDQSFGYGLLGSVVGNGDGVRGYAGSGGSGICGFDHEDGYGHAGLFKIDNTINSEDVVRMQNEGLGVSLFIDANNSTNASSLTVFQNSGIGNYALFEDGNGVNKIRFDNTGKGYFNGGTQTGGADIAEVFDVEDEFSNYEPGDVLVISTEKDRTVVKATEPYSTLVAGVYATKPGVLMTEEHIDADLSGKIPMGIVGVIPTKVCLEGGAIQRGDFLVTSSIPGVAMKGDPDKIRTGQVLGKALENYTSPKDGLIRVLVNVK